MERKEEDAQVKKSEIGIPDAKSNLADPLPTPLEKYMKIIQQNREQELASKVILANTVDNYRV